MTETMRWYNPLRRVYEEAPAPMSDAQAIELLSGHPDSDEFIEEYRRWRATHSDVVRALILTGGAFYVEHRRGPVPKLAAKTLTAPLFLAAVLRPPVVKSPGSVIFTCVGVEGPLKRGSHRGYFVRRYVSAIGYTLQPASLAQEQRSPQRVGVG